MKRAKQKFIAGICILFFIASLGAFIQYDNKKRIHVHDVVIDPFKDNITNICEGALQSSIKYENSVPKIDEDTALANAKKGLERLYDENQEGKKYSFIKEVKSKMKINNQNQEQIQFEVIIGINKKGSRYILPKEISLKSANLKINQ